MLTSDTIKMLVTVPVMKRCRKQHRASVTLTCYPVSSIELISAILSTVEFVPHNPKFLLIRIVVLTGRFLISVQYSMFLPEPRQPTRRNLQRKEDVDKQNVAHQIGARTAKLADKMSYSCSGIRERDTHIWIGGGFSLSFWDFRYYILSNKASNKLLV